ncbi:MAG: hypothetical protein GF364_00535 [Candidatus Lokiarchaeota archaeon]|nr:hypothetical protein [Candidatus Lokiarchaeota archaeon]
MTKKHHSSKKWSKVNIYTEQAKKIENFMNDQKICSRFGILSKSNFVQNAVRREIQRIEQFMDSNTNRSLVNNKIMSENSSDITAEPLLQENPMKIDDFGMKRVAKRVQLKKTIENEAKHGVIETKLRKEIEQLNNKVQSKKKREDKFLQELNELKVKLEEKEENEKKFKEQLEKVKKKTGKESKNRQKFKKELEKLKKELQSKQKQQKKLNNKFKQLAKEKQELERFKIKAQKEVLYKAREELRQEKSKINDLSLNIEEIKTKMNKAIEDMKFEQAAEYRDSLKKVKEKLDNTRFNIKKLNEAVRQKELALEGIGENTLESQFRPPPPKAPPSLGKEPMTDRSESDIVDSLFGDSDENIGMEDSESDIIEKANDLLKEGFEYENKRDYLKASMNFKNAAEILANFMDENNLSDEERSTLQERIESYNEHARYLKQKIK